MTSLFDIVPSLDPLNDRDLATLREFGVRATLRFGLAAPGAERKFDQDLMRLRKAALSGFSVFAPDPSHLPGGALEADLQRLPHLLSLPRVVALGPVGLSPALSGSGESYALERVIALARDLRRPVLIKSSLSADGKAIRKLLGLLRDSAIPPEQVLGMSLPRPALLLFRECGHFIGLSLSSKLSGKALIETISRFGSERLILTSNENDFLSGAKALSLLEEADVPPSVQRRVAMENALRFFGIEEL